MKAPFAGLLTLALLFSGLPPGNTQTASTPGKPAQTAEDFKSLSNRYNAAMQKYYEPYTKAKTDQERQKIRLDPKKSPAIAYLARFQALAQQRKGTEDAAKALIMVMQLAAQANSKAAATAALQELQTGYIKLPVMEQIAQQVGYMSWQIGAEKVEGFLRQVLSQSPVANVRAAATLTLASQLAERGPSTPHKQQEASTLFHSVIKEFGGTQYAKRAEGYLFAQENLQIGKVAPDFEATDENGKTFKLSDYRGKVVVIDFWGFW